MGFSPKLIQIGLTILTLGTILRWVSLACYNRRCSSKLKYMDKGSQDATNDKVIKVSNQQYLPEDIAFSILSRLSIKSIKRFGCIHKSWSLLFENPLFIKMFRKNLLSNDHSYYDDASFFLHNENGPFDGWPGDDFYYFHSLWNERSENKVKLDWPNQLPNADNGFDIVGVGCINGIFCLYGSYKSDITLWNPSTQDVKALPVFSLEPEHGNEGFIDHEGFCYDPIRDDYKVFQHHTRFINQSDSSLQYELDFWAIYSLSTNSWKKLDVNMPHCPINQHVYMDGFCHGWSISETKNEGYLVSFDSGNEVFFTTPMPEDDKFDFNLYWRTLVILNGSIAFFVNHRDDFFHISVLGELGVKESWIKLFIIGPLPLLEYPIGTGKYGDIVFRKYNGHGGIDVLVWFDLCTQEIIKEVDIEPSGYRTKMVMYTKNLLPLESK